MSMPVCSSRPESAHFFSIAAAAWLLPVWSFIAYCARMKRIAIALILTAAHGFAAESWWPQFRGPNCSGVSETAHPPAAFGPGTNQLWKVAVPGGMSSPVVWNDRIFLTTFDGTKLEVHCYARK